MADYFWVGTSGGSGWDDPNGWADTSGGEGGAGVPHLIGDTATFDVSSGYPITAGTILGGEVATLTITVDCPITLANIFEALVVTSTVDISGVSHTFDGDASGCTVTLSVESSFSGIMDGATATFNGLCGCNPSSATGANITLNDYSYIGSSISSPIAQLTVNGSHSMNNFVFATTVIINGVLYSSGPLEATTITIADGASLAVETVSASSLTLVAGTGTIGFGCLFNGDVQFNGAGDNQGTINGTLDLGQDGNNTNQVNGAIRVTGKKNPDGTWGVNGHRLGAFTSLHISGIPPTGGGTPAIGRGALLS